MTDKKYTNEDIISSLKVIATTGNCNECKIRNCKWGTCNCEQITANAALDLITHQQVENKRLEKEVNLVSIQFQDLQERYEEAQAEVERLEKESKDKERAYNDEFCLRKEWQTKCRELLEEKQTAQSEAINEFAERLKNEINIRTTYSREQDKNVMWMIDNLVKEMMSENNDS